MILLLIDICTTIVVPEKTPLFEILQHLYEKNVADKAVSAISKTWFVQKLDVIPCKSCPFCQLLQGFSQNLIKIGSSTSNVDAIDRVKVDL